MGELSGARMKIVAEVDMIQQHATAEETRSSFLAVFGEMRDGWVARAKSEVDLTAELVEKMTAARPVVSG